MDVVIPELFDQENANVFCELGMAHTVGKNVIADASQPSTFRLIFIGFETAYIQLVVPVMERSGSIY